jgi:hypothetical protein
MWPANARPSQVWVNNTERQAWDMSQADAKAMGAYAADGKACSM